MTNSPNAATILIVGACLSGFLQGTAVAAAPVFPIALFHWQPFLGPFHSVLLHFPIGFVVMAFLVDLYYLRRRSLDAQPIIRLILVFAVISSLLTVFLGLMRSDSAEYDAKMLLHHRNYGIAVGALMTATFALHCLAFRGNDTGSPRRALTLGFRGSLFTTMSVIIIAGHQGGNLTHGTNYLTKNAPEFVKKLIEETPAANGESGGAGPVAVNSDDRFFTDKVKPIFDAKCATCHGADKQKGEYRLDQKTVAFNGGESGKPAIKPGEPLQSHLVNLVLLPPDDDDVMPPKGKRALTSDEIMTLIRWIQQGAPFPEAADTAPVKTAAK
jgi:uncharacterized membrane protein/mono/diheme cytochrome c family protein